MTESESRVAIWSTLFSIAIAVGTWASAFTMYGARGGFLIMLILGSLTLCASLTGLVPLAGPFLYWHLQRNVIASSFFGWFPEVASSWMTGVFFWGGLVLSVIFSLVTTLTVFGRITAR